MHIVQPAHSPRVATNLHSIVQGLQLTCTADCIVQGLQLTCTADCIVQGLRLMPQGHDVLRPSTKSVPEAISLSEEGSFILQLGITYMRYAYLKTLPTTKQPEPRYLLLIDLPLLLLKLFIEEARSLPAEKGVNFSTRSNMAAGYQRAARCYPGLAALVE